MLFGVLSDGALSTLLRLMAEGVAGVTGKVRCIGCCETCGEEGF